VEPERVFSGCGRTVTKIKSSLHDNSVDMVTFLRGYLTTVVAKGFKSMFTEVDWDQKASAAFHTKKALKFLKSLFL
jgi:hypothetical protein